MPGGFFEPHLHDLMLLLIHPPIIPTYPLPDVTHSLHWSAVGSLQTASDSNGQPLVSVRKLP